MAKKKNKKWIKFRHRIFTRLAYYALQPSIRHKYHAKVERFRGEDRPYLILYNHQTAYDQFFVATAFKKSLYYVSSEDVLSNGFVSKLIRYAVAPIPIKKQATDARAVLNCLRVSKEGGSIVVAPEGNRTYSGKTEFIKDSIVAFVRTLKLPVAFFRIEGGYGVQPRWSDGTRKGAMRCYVSRVMEKAEYDALSDEELYALIQREMYANEGVRDIEYKSKRTAEYLERAAYYCPDCGLTSFYSDKDLITCQKCGKTIRYLPTKELQGVNGEFPYAFYNDWYDAQSAFVNGLDVLSMTETPLYQEEIRLSQVVLYQKKELLLKAASITLYGDRVEIDGEGIHFVMPFEKVSAVSVLGRNKLNWYYNGNVYQCKGNPRFNALKYVQICYRCKNQLKGDEDGKFLGL